MCSPVQSWSHSCQTFWSKQNTGISPLQILLAQPPCWCTTILQVLCHLYAIQATTSQALRISQTTPYPWTTIEFHFYGLHRETSISMDFIEKLPSSSRFDTILVIVDRLTKQAIFIPAHDTITSADLARLFVLHVFSKHGVPSHVTSDRGLEFVSNFFQSLGTALNIWLHFTSDYHPEGDGQTECTN